LLSRRSRRSRRGAPPPAPAPPDRPTRGPPGPQELSALAAALSEGADSLDREARRLASERLAEVLGREEELNAARVLLLSPLAAWKVERRLGAVLVVGAAGSGKASWLAAAEQRTGDLPSFRLVLERRLLGAEDLVASFAAALVPRPRPPPASSCSRRGSASGRAG
jgi:hypothetical protein